MCKRVENKCKKKIKKIGGWLGSIIFSLRQLAVATKLYLIVVLGLSFTAHDKNLKPNFIFLH